MSNEPIRTPVDYMYLDVTGIESLYAQTVDRLETELVEKEKQGRNHKAEGKIGFGHLLGKLLGLDAEIKAEISGLRETARESKTTLSPEQKLLGLLSYLNALSPAELFLTLREAADAASKQKSVFVQVADVFDAPQFFPGEGGAQKVTSDGALELKGELGGMRVVMAAGLPKFTRLKGHMARLSHESLFFQADGGRNKLLNVFGRFTLLRPMLFQIKPYAIWH